jgi:RNA polymerase sigma-70 factor (ECF subfamily)
MLTVMAPSINQTLDQFQAYLECLVAIQVDPRLCIDPRMRRRFGWSDIINKTLEDASRDLERIRGMTEPEQQCWLRTILANNLVDRIRKELARRRDCRLEHSLEEAIEQSSCRVRDWQPVDESTPSEKLMRQERALLLAEALAKLPEKQREAIILQTYHGWTLARIAERLECTVGRVAGLQARGKARLRELLPADLLEGS